MTINRLADRCWGATLVSLPLCGVGLVHALTGRDLGAGLQPAFLLLALTWVLRLAGEPRALWRNLTAPERRPGWLVLLALLLVVLVSSLGMWTAPAPVMPDEAVPRFFRQVIQFLVMLAFTVHAWLWTRDRARWRSTVTWLAAGLALQVVYGPLQGAMATGWLPWLEPVDRLATSNPSILSGSSWLYLGQYLAVPRLRGTMCEPLYLGSYLLAVVPLVFAGRRRWLAAAGVLLLGATWSRGAWAAAVVGLAAWLVLARRIGLRPVRRRGLLGATAVLAAVAVLTFALGGADTFMLPWRRLLQTLDGSDWSNLTRFYSAQVAWRGFLQSPVWGVGWGQFAYHFYDLVDLSGLQSQFTWPVVNSIPLLLLCETGALGLVVATGSLLLAAGRTWRGLRSGQVDATLGLALTAAAVASGTQLLMFSQYNLPHLWVLPGLWLAAFLPAPQEESP